MRKKESLARPKVNPGATEVKPTASAKTEEEVKKLQVLFPHKTRRKRKKREGNSIIESC